MGIFEQLENLNVSEECFDDILGIVEEYINEVSVNMWKNAAKNSIPSRIKAVRKGPYEKTTVYSGKGKEEFRKPSGYNKEEGVADEKDLIRLKRAKDIVSNFTNSKKSANKLVKAADKVIKDRDSDNMCADIYGYEEGDPSGRLKKAELALSANKKKYQKFRDQENSETNPYSPYDSPHYDERKGKYNQDPGEGSPELRKK